MDILVREYIREDGSSPYTDWFNGLDPYAAAKVTTATVRLGLGNTSNLKRIAGGISEYVVNWGPGYRIYLARKGKDLIILFGGDTKRRQQRDIVTAIALRSEYRARKQKNRKKR